MLVPINLTGGTYKHASLPVSAQSTRNFWPQKQDIANAKSPYVLVGFHGLKLWGSSNGGADRGMLEHKGMLYKVSGQNLYKVIDGGEHTWLGSIEGIGRCIMEGMGDSVVVVSDGNVFEWNGTTLTQGTDSDFETPNGCAHINNQMIYDGDNGRWCSSDVGSPLSIDGLNYATAESNADSLLRPFVLSQDLYLMGAKSIELWYNSGVDHPPFDRRAGMLVNIGLGAIHSVAKDEDSMYFLGNDSQVYAMAGNSITPISHSALAHTFAGYQAINDAIGWCSTIDGHSMYFLTFPNEGKTWVYPKGGDWFEWSYGDNGGRSIANSYAFAFRKHLIADYRNGNIYELSAETFTDNGEPIIRMRDTAPIHGGLLNKPGKRIEMNRFELILEAGIGLTQGQGEDPSVMLSYSDDGGKTFSAEMWGTVGRLGAFQWKLEWFALGSFESRVLRIKTSDPVRFVITHAATDIEVGI